MHLMDGDVLARKGNLCPQGMEAGMTGTKDGMPLGDER